MGRKKITDKTELLPVDETINEMFALEEARQEKKQIGYIPSFFTTASLPFKNLHNTFSFKVQ